MAQDELFALMHDTMSPVNTTKGSANLLLENKGLNEEEKKKLLNGIIERADRLNSILDEYFKNERKKQGK